MVQVLQKQLEILAIDSAGIFSRRICKRLGKRPPKGLEDDLKEFVLLLPSVERRILDLWLWLPPSSKLKNTVSHFLTYMYQSHDFIPENEGNGLFGYLDDVYLAALFYEFIINEIEGAMEFCLLREDDDLLGRIIGLKRTARSVIPDEAVKIEKMLEELIKGDDKTYTDPFLKKTPGGNPLGERKG